MKKELPCVVWKKDFLSSILKGVSLVYDIGNSSHNLTPICHGECAVLIRALCVCHMLEKP